MSRFRQLPLGTRIPESIHAVSVSMPTMKDVIDYEEKIPEVVERIESGYPRFVVHKYLREISRFWEKLFDKPKQPIWLTSSEKITKELEAYLDCEGTKFQSHGGITGLRIPENPELNLKAKRFLQHVGGFLSTRHAEDYLVANDFKKGPEQEELFEGDAYSKIASKLKELCGDNSAEEVIIANSGMNAIYASFQAINEIQGAKGRKSWIKFGWLYADTMHILDKLSQGESDNAELFDIFELEALESLLESRKGQFAGLITEVPTNPLIQCMDLERIRDLATKYGFYLVLDPTINSPANVDVSPYADIIVNSLTKYAANEGDVIMGAAVVLSHCPERDAIIHKIESLVEQPYERDLRRLAQQIDGYFPLVDKTNKNVEALVPFLEQHARIKKVYWAKERVSQRNYERIARHQKAVGSMLSFEVNGSLAGFYDNLPMAKGPSFGMQQSLACPFIYLAHYDLIQSKSGRRRLRGASIPPDLVRLGVGTEPIESIIEAIEIGLKGI